MTRPLLHVFAGGERAGVLTRSDVEEDAVLFGYVPNTPPQRAVSLTMPVRADQYDAAGGLLPVFEMNLPEGALRERLRLQFAKAIPGFDDLDLLGIVGTSQIGRLRYAYSETLDETMPAQDLEEILTYAGSADLFAHLLERFATYSGVSGMQPKVLIRDRGTVPDKVTYRGATHIVKTFDPGEYPELAANEMICSAGAAAAGIDTVRVRLSENRRFLVVDRFDFTEDGDYLGIEDFCVLEGLRAHGRYDGAYEGVARRIADFVSPAVLARAREQYALQVIYACTIGNGDAHLKNFAVLYRHPEDTIKLAPAYDLVSTVPYFPRDTLALSLAGTKAFPVREVLIEFARTVTRKPRGEAAALLDPVEEGVETALAQAALFGAANPDAAGFVETLTEAFHAGLRRLRGS